MTNFSITSAFKNWLDFQFSAVFLMKCRCASLRLLTDLVCFFCVREFRFAPFHPINFSKEKKKKKKAVFSSGRFQKSKFFG
tara:strand:- start:670 stop:912 length:243 start_codon:yes stop_codon:yes gene_type:complete